MTSLAGIRSWNFSGRRGVNSATAWRTVAGSNEGIGRNGLDVNREPDGRQDGRGEAMVWIIPCQSPLVDRLRS